MNSNLNPKLIEFLQNSPTPFHATANLAKALAERGYIYLDESKGWDLQPGNGYYTVRSGSSIVAFLYGENKLVENGIRVLGAHTDSPCLKVKPQPELDTKGYQQVGIEVYGGALLNPWFDRDLSLAGRVSYIDESGCLKQRLIDFKKPIAVIPSLAIHLDRSANDKRTINPQTQMNPLLGIGEKLNIRELLQQEIDDSVQEVFDFNLSFYDTQPPGFVGLNNEFIASARLDNLLSCYLGLEALLSSEGKETCILVCNDHEEVGSRSDVGAQGTMLEDILQRLLPNEVDRQRCIRSSMMLSVDNAHGVHPNYKDKHDSQHGPLLNSGLVIKYDADQSYATSDETAAFLKWLASGSGDKGAEEAIPLQSYVTRADMRCGSTIGPLTATKIGIKTIDIGVPTFAMHSIRELAGTEDSQSALKLLKKFVNVPELP